MKVTKSQPPTTDLYQKKGNGTRVKQPFSKVLRKVWERNAQEPVNGVIESKVDRYA
jgi:hypothetical protein